MSKRSHAHAQSGFSLLELMVVLTAGVILIIASANMFVKFRSLHRHDQRIRTTEAELTFALQKAGQALTTAPGRGLGVFSGLNYSPVGKLPAIGVIQTGTTQQLIPLGIITPFKYGAGDAITILTTSSVYERFEMIEDSQDLGNRGLARVTSPGINSRSGSIIPINPGNVGSGSLQNGLPKQGEIFFLVGVPPIRKVQLPVRPNPPIESAEIRLARLNSQARSMSTATRPSVKYLELDYEFIANGSGTSLPGLINTSNMRIFGIGSAVIKPNFVTIYLSTEGKVIRNEGGVPIYDPNTNGIQLTGGIETPIGDADSLTISYKTTDNSSDMPTPKSPLNTATWLNKITAVNMTLERAVPPLAGQEAIKRSIGASFSVASRFIE